MCTACRTSTVLRYSAREAFMLGSALPLTLLALMFWYPPYALNNGS